MKILVTGGLGFIGQAVARPLLQRGHEVVLLDNLSRQIHGELPSVAAPEGATILRVDVLDLSAQSAVIEDCDAVVHLAAETGTAQSMYRIEHYARVNELGTAALLECIAKAPRRKRRFVLASSRSVYGEGAYQNQAGELVQPRPRPPRQFELHDWEHRATDGSLLRPVPTPESLPFDPASIYAATKASQELLVRSASDALGLHSTILRFQNVYGEGQSLLNPYTGIISIFFNRARQGLEVPIFEDGAQSRDFVHVDDVVAAILIALESEVPSGSVVNVGSGEATSVFHLAKALVAASGFQVPVRVTSQYRVGDIRHCYSDSARLRRLFGLTPQISLEQGLVRFCAWASTQPVHPDRSAAAISELSARGLAGL